MGDKQLKIVKIIDEYKVVVNGGLDYGLSIGDTLKVYQNGKPVTDPDTNEDLGNLDPIKAYLEIVHIYDKMCVCVNNEESQVLTPIARAFEPIQRYMYDGPKKLNIDPKDISGGWFTGDDRQIKVGDLVKKT